MNPTAAPAMSMIAPTRGTYQPINPAAAQKPATTSASNHESSDEVEKTTPTDSADREDASGGKLQLRVRESASRGLAAVDQLHCRGPQISDAIGQRARRLTP